MTINDIVNHYVTSLLTGARKHIAEPALVIHAIEAAAEAGHALTERELIFLTAAIRLAERVAALEEQVKAAASQN